MYLTYVFTYISTGEILVSYLQTMCLAFQSFISKDKKQEFGLSYKFTNGAPQSIV